MRRVLVFWVYCLGACGPGSRAGVDGGDPCVGDETRCVDLTYQVCTGGSFTDEEFCAGACIVGHGCAKCQPEKGNACSNNNVVVCNPDGTFGAEVEMCRSDETCLDGECRGGCTTEGIELIYLVDEQKRFLSFDPRLLPGDPFRLLGILGCPVTKPSLQMPPGLVGPFSMSVDRKGKAWVEYSSGEIFNVSIENAACTATGYVPAASGMNLFGMGFVSDEANESVEKLYIAGGGRSAEPSGRLAVVDVGAADYTPQIIGSYAAQSDFSPELTGTSDGKLYGFFPVISSGPAFIQEIDTGTGMPFGPRWDLGTTGLGGAIRSWAFAQWGGKFYVFVAVNTGGIGVSSTVRSIDKATGTYTIELDSIPYNIPGAGVSTCAPIVN